MEDETDKDAEFHTAARDVRCKTPPEPVQLRSERGRDKRALTCPGKKSNTVTQFLTKPSQ